jgi:hypothetical protein
VYFSSFVFSFLLVVNQETDSSNPVGLISFSFHMFRDHFQGVRMISDSCR